MIYNLLAKPCHLVNLKRLHKPICRILGLLPLAEKENVIKGKYVVKLMKLLIAYQNYILSLNHRKDFGVDIQRFILCPPFYYFFKSLIWH